MGGEKVDALRREGVTAGSPPHGRGKVTLHFRPSSWPRITPAWAGKRTPSRASECPARDHPRMGGEKRRKRRQETVRLGSPPHGRGKVADLVPGVLAAGITPAWAGKSPSGCRSGGCGQDHPRMGGEKLTCGWNRTIRLGSPPHGRGKGSPSRPYELPAGITPAWAGKRRRCWWLSPPVRDHPRMGGEKRCRQRSVQLGRGSPPHGRGKA